MYLPRAFTETDLAQLDRLLQADPFITLVSTDAGGAPVASQLPVLYRRNGDDILIEGHWARANPQSRHQGEVLLLVHGPHAYVSPAWYPDKEAEARVPTWNYASAQLRGSLERFEDEASLADLVSRLSDRFEAQVGSDWHFEPQREDHRVQLRGIVGFRFLPRQVDLKFKLSQNHPVANRESVIAQLQGQAREHSRNLAALMRERDAETGD
jgi:transcriptional regulator